MTNLTTIIENANSKFADMKAQLDELKKDADEDIQELEETHTELSDWLESKKDEVDQIIEDAKANNTDIDLVSDQVTGILDDIEETMNDWDTEYEEDLEDIK